MSIHLLYRTPYKELNHKYYRVFDQETIVEWFNNLWRYYHENSQEFYSRITEHLGENIYGFWGPFFSKVNSKEWEKGVSNPNPPKSIKEVKAYIENGYIEDVEIIKENAIQILTEDDELDLAYYIFDDKYASAYPEFTSYLIQDKWELPESYSMVSDFQPTTELKYNLGRDKSELETTYLIMSSDWMSGGNLGMLDSKVCEVKGVRLNELMEFLADQIPNEKWNLDLLFLRSQIQLGEKSVEKSLTNYSRIPEFYIQKEPSLELYYDFDIEQLKSKDHGIGQKYIDDFYHEKFKSSRININRKDVPSRFQFSKHMVQASVYVENWESHPTFNVGKDFPLFYHYIIFDDLWATSNKNLANSILNYGMRWDVFK